MAVLSRERIHVTAAFLALAVVVSFPVQAGEGEDEDLIPVPVAPNVRVVDYGSDMGGGWYRDHLAQLFSRPAKGESEARAARDVDGDGETADDSVSGWAFSLDEPLSPVTDPQYNHQAPSSRFYGGIIGHNANAPGLRLTEGGMNTDHELRDDWNFMGPQSAATKRSDTFARGWAVWLWLKEDFLNDGDSYRVTFDDQSMLAVHISRYWDDIDLGRWVVREGGQLYISEATFGTAEQIEASGRRGTHRDWILHPTDSRWAAYNPTTYDTRFAPDSAEWQVRDFRHVTGVGFYMAKDSKTNGVISVKWNAFEAYANVARPEKPCHMLEMREVPAGEGVPAFDMARTEVAYRDWEKIYRWAVSNQYCFDLDQRGYCFDRDGDMGTMDLGGTHDAREPATDMTWADAVAWCNALSEFEGRAPCYYADPDHEEVFRVVRNRNHPDRYGWRPTVHVKWDADGFRLPTAAEWTRAAGERDPARARFGGGVWEFVWDGDGKSIDCDAQRKHTVYAATTTPGGGERARGPVNGRGASPTVGFRIVRGSGAAPPTQSVHGAATRVLDESEPPPAPPKPEGLLGEDDFVEIAHGSFIRDDDATVTVSPFEMLKTEVTFALWNTVRAWAVTQGYDFDHDGDMGSMDWDAHLAEPHHPDEPVTDIGWTDARLFCNALSEIEGRTPVYYTDEEKTAVYRAAIPWRIRMIGEFNAYSKDMAQESQIYTKWEADGYRLPTWAEYGMAWREGETQKWPHHLTRRDGECEWLRSRSGGRTHPVGTTEKPGPFGLYDLGGNVSEWLQDIPKPDYYRSHNPKGIERGGGMGKHPAAGGHFFSDAQMGFVKPAVWEKPSSGRPTIGFRVVRCEARAHSTEPWEPEVVIDADPADFDPLVGQTFRGSLHRTGYYGPGSMPAIEGAKWTFRTGGPVRSSSVVTDGTVYVGSDDGFVYALDAADGSLEWKFDAGGEVTASPTIADGKVFIGSEGSGWMFALDAATGEEVWRYAKDDQAARYPVNTSPAYAFGHVFVGTRGGFVGLDGRTGEKVWQYRFGRMNHGLLAPTIHGTTIYIPTNDIHPVAIDIRTEMPVDEGHGHHCQASMAYEDGMILYNTGPGCNVMDAFDLMNPHFRFRISGGAGLSFFPESGPALHDGWAYCAKGDEKVYAFRQQGGKWQGAWSRPVGMVVSSLALIDRELIFGCEDGNVYALDRATGEEVWRFETDGAVKSSPCIEDGVVYIGSDDGNVYAIR